MITRETDYALRALLRLAQQPGGVVSTTVLAEEMEIPYRFLRRILLKLAEQGLVVNVRGTQGGARLGQEPESISLLDIVRAIDPASVTLNLCLTGDNACHRAPHCTVHDALADIQTELQFRFAGVTLASLVAQDRALCELQRSTS